MKSKNLQSVFVVEDSEMERTMLKDHLGKYPDLNVTEFSSGSACIKDLIVGTVEEPDLILMDFFMDSSFGPSKDGLESLAKLKEISPDTQVIMFTSVENPKIIELCKKGGALDYVVKGPSAFNDLDKVLSKHYTMKK